jgi:hypothetical protein
MWSTLLQDFGVSPLGVLNWERLKTNKTPFWHDLRWHLPIGTPVVLDEIHKGASGPESQTGRAAAMLKAYGFPVIMVSATLASSPLQMRHTGYLMGLHDWNDRAWKTWLEAHGCWYDRDYRYWRTPSGKKGKATMSDLNRQMSDSLLYCRLEDIPGFPESVLEVKLYNLEDRETSEIQAAYADMSARMKKAGASELAETNKARERIEMVKTSLFAELIKDGLAQDKSVVVFLNYREPLARLRKLLSDAKIENVSMIYGAQDTGASTINRDHEIKMFQENVNHVCLAMSQSGSVAISLHDVKKERGRISYISPSFSASDTKQCLGRIHRIGGTPVVQIFVLAANTIEERVYSKIKGKLQNIKCLIDTDCSYA